MYYRYVFPSLLLGCTHHRMWWSVNISLLMFTQAKIFWRVLLEQTRQVHSISLRLPPHYSQGPRECYNPPKREALKQRPGKTKILLGEIKTLSSCDHHRKRSLRAYMWFCYPRRLSKTPQHIIAFLIFFNTTVQHKLADLCPKANMVYTPGNQSSEVMAPWPSEMFATPWKLQATAQQWPCVTNDSCSGVQNSHQPACYGAHHQRINDVIVHSQVFSEFSSRPSFQDTWK